MTLRHERNNASWREISMGSGTNNCWCQTPGELHLDSTNRSHEGLTLETSAFKLFTVANLCFQLS